MTGRTFALKERLGHLDARAAELNSEEETIRKYSRKETKLKLNLSQLKETLSNSAR